MLELFGLPVGTALQGGTFLTAIVALGIWWIRGAPDRHRAKNETKLIDASEMEKVLADYATQVKAFRVEVHALRNELQALQGELRASDKVSQQRNERISTMELIIELLITELERLDPNSVIVRQAKMMMRRISGGFQDPTKSHEMNSAEAAVADAKQTVSSAERTVVEIEANEAREAGHDGE